MQLLDRFFIFRDVKVVIECRHVHGTHGIGHKTCRVRCGNKTENTNKSLSSYFHRISSNNDSDSLV